ncbi:DoxX family protein [Mycobacterium cookii]|uniref:DoxX family protein n=1 Tax=Nocardioides furvisabuli TaxID=375542 RepID=A0ABN2XKA5_9ACTN|nr:DoxX family protein [Nocardioides furvisabuli]
MNIVLWVIAVVLAAVFTAAGLRKVLTPREKVVEDMTSLEDLPAGAIKLIGVVEVLGAVGLVVPAALDIAPVLTPLAASGLAVTMLLAAAVHARRKEYPLIGINVVLGGLALFVAIMRFGPQAF